SPEILKVVFEDGSEKKFMPDKIIIATGSVPAVPPIKGLKESKGWIDSTKALSLEKVPKSMIVIGGGVIGIEMATIYSQLGCEITVIEAMPKILPLMDEELGTLLARRMGRKKIKIMTSTSVLSVEDKDDEVEVTISDGKEEKTLLAEKVLVAVGRKSYTDTLNLDESGIEYDGSRILVNDRMETNVPGIYAIGDCTGSTMLAHVASAQGEIAAENAMNGKRSYDESTCPSCVYTSPEFAGVGLTEAKAAQMGYKYKIGKFPLKANGKALIMNNGEGVVKFVVEEESDKILGVHILGSRATDLIGEAAIAIGMGASIEDLANVIHAHPTLSEAIREGALSSIHLAIHIPNK
ncbi:MAG: dihydrolipoyl dehydrogenase family protein, partial [[Clostridium] scindens]